MQAARPTSSWPSTASSRRQPGTVARSDGDAAKALAGAAKVLEATYEFPYLAHAAMEPLNCVVRLADDGRCEVWNGEQIQTADQARVAQVLGLKPEQVTINMLYAGGSFGRRANPAVGLRARGAEIAIALARPGTRGSGQAGVDARGRHARGLLPARRTCTR